MTKFIRGFLYLVLVILAPLSNANMPTTINEIIPTATLVGQGKMTYFFWDVYNAELFTPDGQWHGEPPFALTLTYLRDFKGKDIAERSIKEMQKQGFNDESKLNEWEQTMKDIFPDVSEESQLTGVLLDNGETLFYDNEKQLAVIEDTGFGKQFFAIWLSEKTSEPRLRSLLIGEAK